MILRFAEWIDTIRYDHPGSYLLAWTVAIMVGMATVFVMLPDTPLLRAMGVTEFKTRTAALVNALYWSSRAAIHGKATTEKPTILYGNMEGIDSDGKLIVSVTNGTQWVHRSYALADTVIADIYGVAKHVADHRKEDARFDIYNGDQVVVWVRGAPFNVKLIEDGVATPDPKPPTDIIDIAFATYYWNIVKGKPGENKS